MTSERQQAANRRNARSSTGPRTPLGRKTSAMNATRHGLNAKAPGGALDAETQALADEIERAFPGQPVGALAVALARKRIERVRSLKLAALETALRQAMPRGERLETSVPNELEAAAIRHCLRTWKVLDGYERKFVSSLQRAVSDLCRG